MSATAISLTYMLAGTVAAAAAARAHYVTRSRNRREVYWCVLALGVTAVLAPLMVGAFSWNGALQFFMHTVLVLLAVYSAAVYTKHERVAHVRGGRAVMFEQQWSAITMATGMVAFSTLLGYILVYPLY